MLRRTLVIVLLALAGAGCQQAGGVARPSEAGAGHLIIAGGGTKADNAEIYGSFMAPLPGDAVIGVLPTASASPAESAASSAGTLTRHAGARTVEAIEITVGNGAAADPGVVERLGRCSALWFTGGVQSRIVGAFRPPSGDAPAYAAAKAVLSRGGVIGGTSAGAAMMCDPMITGGRSDDALLGRFRAEGEDAGFGLGKGMGFFPFGVVDQHFLRRGRLGRLVVALERTGQSRGYGIEENCALDVDLAAGAITVLGPGAAAVMVDVSEMKRDGDSRTGVRISLLCSGDRVDGRTGLVQVASARAREGAAPAGGSSATSDTGADPASTDAWGAGAITRALHRLARERSSPVDLHSAAFDVRISADDRTRFHRGAAGSDRLTIINARLDITARRPSEGKP